ncbi:MAG TPA: M56 family metallopeptidase [Terriglobales bacterium]|nr:M56 family metallopeptidase [Terriglobales bacterium]
MIFVARGMIVSLAFFSLAYSFLSCLALLTWRGMRFFSRRPSVNLLFSLRVLPFVVSAAITGLLAFPSFLLLEAHTMDEDLATFALSVSAGLFLGAGFYQVMSAAARTRQVVAECLEGARALWAKDATSLVTPRSVLPLMLIGIRTPRVLISETACEVLSEGELRAAVRHEVEHLRSRDNLKKVVLSFIPFPLMAELERAWQEAAELAADNRAVSSREDALDLAAALIKLSRRFPPQAAPAFTTGLVSVTGSVAKRVECLLAWKENPVTADNAWRYAVAGAFTAMVGLAAKLGPVLVLMHSLTERLVP